MQRKVFVFVFVLFNLYTKSGAQTQYPKIKSRMPLPLSQPGAPKDGVLKNNSRMVSSSYGPTDYFENCVYFSILIFLYPFQNYNLCIFLWMMNRSYENRPNYISMRAGERRQQIGEN